MAYEEDGIIQMEEKELHEIIVTKADEFIVVDVRELNEYEESHIPGIPLIPMNSIPLHLEQLQKDASYIFVCRSGGRSQAVAQFLKEQGFNDVRNYAGGMLAWTGPRNSGLEWVIEDGSEVFTNK